MLKIVITPRAAVKNNCTYLGGCVGAGVWPETWHQPHDNHSFMWPEYLCEEALNYCF